MLEITGRIENKSYFKKQVSAGDLTKMFHLAHEILSRPKRTLFNRIFITGEIVVYIGIKCMVTKGYSVSRDGLYPPSIPHELLICPLHIEGADAMALQKGESISIQSFNPRLFSLETQAFIQ